MGRGSCHCQGSGGSGGSGGRIVLSRARRLRGVNISDERGSKRRLRRGNRGRKYLMDWKHIGKLTACKMWSHDAHDTMEFHRHC